MAKQKFNPDKWQRNAALSLRDEVEIVTRRIEGAALDITCAYSDWLSLGFALARGRGGGGARLLPSPEPLLQRLQACRGRQAV